MCCWPLLVLWALLPCATAGDSGRTFPHRTFLDAEGKYGLSWGPRDGRLAFRLEVRTAGYVGFGFSPTGAMAAADIVVGGVAHGRPYLQVSASTPGVGPVPTPEHMRVTATWSHRRSLWPRLDDVAPRIPSHGPPCHPAPLPPRSSFTPGAQGSSGAASRLRCPAPSFRPGRLSTSDSRKFSVSEYFPVPSPALTRPSHTHLPHITLHS